MFKTASTPCVLCDLKALTRSFRSSSSLSWQPSRFIAQMQSRRPPVSRMVLSPNVAEPSSRYTPRKRGNSPFGGMNRTDAGMLPPERTGSPFKPARTSGRRAAKMGKTQSQSMDMKALKMQQVLSRVSYGHRAAVKQRLLNIESFHEFDLLPSIQDSISTRGLRGITDAVPTPIQRLAIPALLGTGDKNGRRGLELVQPTGMRKFLMAAETGSGKTLAYLLPTLDSIKRSEQVENDEKTEKSRKEEAKVESMKGNIWELESPPVSLSRHPDAGRPRVIILQPTSELVDQVGAVVKAFSHSVKFRAALISASYSATVIRNRLFAPGGIDVVVSTPYLLGNLAESDPNILSRVSHLIIDEADSLFDRGFAPLTSTIIDKATPSLKQLIMCSATIPRSLDNYLRDRFPDIQRLATPNLHAIPRRVQLTVVDIEKDPYRGNRDLACADTIWNIGQSNESITNETADTKRIIVFVNEREKSEEVAKYLSGKGIDAVALNRDTSEQRHREMLSTFTSRDNVTMPQLKQVGEAANIPSDQVLSPRQDGSHRTLPNTKVLVMTDLGSRGIDTIAVRNVILYDVPHSTIDFIHRLGRTGRMGRRGRGFVLLGKGDRNDVVREVREGMFRGQALI